jgi:signal transduction histidine kinase
MELDLGEVDASEIVKSAIAALRDKFVQAKIALTVDVASDAGRLIADARRIRQILINLLSNAIAFSEERGRVHVSARRLAESIEFAVADQGPGVPHDFLRAAFDRFASMPRGAGRGGVGLGLSIVKSFVALHGGTVELQSEEGKGATVTVRLPIRPPAVAAVAAE